MNALLQKLRVPAHHLYPERGVRRDGTGTRVDIRSESRVGGSDVGANAARIRKFSGKLREALGAH